MPPAVCGGFFKAANNNYSFRAAAEKKQSAASPLENSALLFVDAASTYLSSLLAR